VDRRALEKLRPDLHPFVEPVRERLLEVAAVKPGAIEPTVAAIAATLGDYPGRDFIPAVGDYVQWAVHGPGRGRKVKDVVRQYRNWISKNLDVVRKTPPPNAPAGQARTPDDTAARLAEAER
jgi:hypothetical protein